MNDKYKKFVFCSAGVLIVCFAVLMGTSGRRDSRAERSEPPIPEADAVQEKADQFIEWMSSGSGQNLEQGIEFAKARGERMRELIRTHPARAIREALSLAEWAALPPEMQAHVEQPFSTVANVEVLISCGEEHSETITEIEFSSSDRIETFVYGRRSEMGSKRGIPVQGIRIGKVSALRNATFLSLGEDDEKVALGLYPVAVPDPGGDSVAALAGGKLFYFPSQDKLDEANARLAALEELPGEHSGGQALFEALDELLVDGEIDFEALDVLAMAAAEEWTGTPRSTYAILVDFPDKPGAPADPVAFSNSLNTTVSQQIWDMSYEKTHIVGTVNTNIYRMPLTNEAYTSGSLYTAATNAVAGDGVDLSPYQTVCVVHKGPGSYAGLASVGGGKMWLKSTSPKVVVHEFGHNYGSSHASFWDVTGGDPVDPTGSRVEYGDFTDIMGSADVPEGHFNAWHKKKIAWFDADNWSSVTNSGTYRLYRSDHRQTTGLIRGLEIGKGGGTNEYWVGLRQEYPGYEAFSRGAYLLWKQNGTSRSHLVDTTPLSADGKYDGGLALGQTYSDAAGHVHITPVDRGGQTPNEWMDVTVNLGDFPGNSAPSASLNVPTNLSVRSSALISVTASDPDGDELAYQWGIGDGLVKPNAPSIPVAWMSGGTATVSCTVSDMKGGTNRVSQTVVLTDPLDSWMQHTSGTTKHLNDIAVGGGRLVAVGDNGTTAYSDTGTNWTVHTSANVWLGNAYLEGVVYDGSQFIAVGMDYDFGPPGWELATYTSPDGTYWTERYDSNSGSGSTIRLNDVAHGGGYYIAVGDDGAIVRSTDGVSWSTNASGTTIDLAGISYGDGTFVVVGADSGGGPAVVLTSADGLSWSNHSAGVDLDDWKGFYEVEYCNDRFLASGWYARILHSTDQGQTFTTQMSGDRQNIAGFSYGNGIYFAAGENLDAGVGVDINVLSLDGATWTELTTSSQDRRNAAIFYNGTFITVGNNGSIWQSDPVGSPSGGYAVWQSENEDSLGFNRDPNEDADFDGSPNLVEYAMGSSAFDSGSQPSYLHLAEPDGYFQVSYERNGIVEDVDYAVERSVDLVANDWSSATTVVLEDSPTNLMVRSAYPTSSQTNEFMRLNIGLK
jgi:hypothetical protein